MPPIDPQPRPTIATVADKAGVSISTVSRALRNHPLVAESTRSAIQRIAAEVGYSPNPFISTLMAHLRSSKPVPYQASIALLDTLASPDEWKKFVVQRQFHQGASARATRLGYKLERFWAFAKGLDRDRLTRILVSRGIHGVIVPPFRDHSSNGADIPLDTSQFAIVTVGCKLLDPAFHFATNDQYLTGQLAHDRLLDLGYKRVALAIPAYVESIVERRFSAGFRNALERLGRTVHRNAILRYDRDAGPKPVLAWFDAFKPDAVCTTFPEVRDWIEAAGHSVPSDVAFASLDWNPTMQNWAGIDQENDRVGSSAVDLLVQLLQRNEIGPPEHSFGLMIEGTWVEGPSAPKRPKSGS